MIFRPRCYCGCGQVVGEVLGPSREDRLRVALEDIADRAPHRHKTVEAWALWAYDRARRALLETSGPQQPESSVSHCEASLDSAAGPRASGEVSG